MDKSKEGQTYGQKVEDELEGAANAHDRGDDETADRLFGEAIKDMSEHQPDDKVEGDGSDAAADAADAA